MVLKLTGVDYILRLDAVDLRYPGGRKALINENATKLGRLAFFDDDLMIFHTLVGVPEFRLWDNYFEERGLELTDRVRGIRVAGFTRRVRRAGVNRATGWA